MNAALRILSVACLAAIVAAAPGRDEFRAFAWSLALSHYGISLFYSRGRLEDLAGAVPDDLVGWTERPKERDAEPIRHKGILDGFEVGRREAEDLIMAARIAAGWVTEEELEKARAQQAEAAAAAEAAKAAEATAAAPAVAKL